MSLRLPPKISLKHEWTRELGPKVARQPEWEVARQPEEVARDRSGRLDDMQDGRNTSRSQEINVNSFNEELSSSDRTVRPVATLQKAEAQDGSQVCHEGDTLNVDDEVLRKRMEKSIVVHDENHETMMVNEADMDFRIPGLPQSVVKYAQSTSVRQLIQKIENHPDRHAVQKDLRQNQSCNPLSRIKANDSGCG